MKSTYHLQLNVPQLDAAAVAAFKETAFLLGREFSRVITEPRYWQATGDVRDIVDRGQLRSSQQLTFTQPLEAVYSWPVEHAIYQHEGYELRNGERVEGRPWTTIALQEFDVQETFRRLYERNLRAI
jgi:hypothetical protein